MELMQGFLYVMAKKAKWGDESSVMARRVVLLSHSPAEQKPDQRFSDAGVRFCGTEDLALPSFTLRL